MAARREGYSALQIGLHWLVLAMVAVQLVIGESMTEMVEAAEEGEAASASVTLWGTVHYWLGIVIFAVMFFRLGTRLIVGAPAHAGEQSRAQELAATALHWAFYVVLLVSPISGLIAYYGIADIGEIHGLAKPVLIILIGLHVLAALYNQYIRKDGTLTRMLRPQ